MDFWIVICLFADFNCLLVSLESSKWFFFFSEKKPCLKEIAREALIEFNYILEVLSSTGQKEIYLDRRICHWSKPPKDCFKINVDGSWLINSSRWWLGYLIRNEEGCCYLAVAAFLQVTYALATKLLAIRSSLGYLHNCPTFTNSRIVIETDYKAAILLIEGQHASSEPDINSTISEIRFILSKMSNCKLQYIPPEINRAAD